MIIRLILTGLLALVSWSPAKACSPLPSKAQTESSYEATIASSAEHTYRELVDMSAKILIGEFKYSKKRKSHRLHVSETLKLGNKQKPSKKVSVSFNGIDNDRVTYGERRTALLIKDNSTDLFMPAYYLGHVDGSYGPGDCGISLDLVPETKYLVFLNDKNTVISMYLIQEDGGPLEKAIRYLIANPSIQNGIAYSLPELLEKGRPFRLFETLSCSPKPVYKVLESANIENAVSTYSPQPILVFDKDETRYLYDFTEEELVEARAAGLSQGLFIDAPPLDMCKVGQKYLSIGNITYASSNAYNGQMIPETNGVFDLSDTVFQHDFLPSKVSISDISELLKNHTK